MVVAVVALITVVKEVGVYPFGRGARTGGVGESWGGRGEEGARGAWGVGRGLGYLGLIDCYDSSGATLESSACIFCLYCCCSFWYVWMFPFLCLLDDIFVLIYCLLVLVAC